MKPIRKKRLFAIGGMLLGLGFAATLTLMALKENINLFYTPLEVSEHKAPQGQLFRLGGMVVDSSIKRGEGLAVKFTLTDYKAKVQVNYDGILPDLFREGQGIVTMGKLNDKGEFEAREILAKHDANYMPPEVKAAIAREQT